MKNIIRITKDGNETKVGVAESIYAYLLAEEHNHIVPMSGDKDYKSIDNIYCEELDEFVSYKSEDVC